MSKKFHTQLLTPEGSLFDGDTVSVQVPGISGNFQILYNHAPIVSSMGVGKIVIQTPENEELVYAVSGGFVEMSNNRCSLLAEKAEQAGDIDRDEALKQRDELKEQLKNLTQNREKAELELAIAENRLKIADI